MDLDMKAGGGGGGGDQKVQVAVQAVVVLGDNAAAAAVPKQLERARLTPARKGQSHWPSQQCGHVQTRSMIGHAWFISVTLPPSPALQQCVRPRVCRVHDRADWCRDLAAGGVPASRNLSALVIVVLSMLCAPTSCPAALSCGERAVGQACVLSDDMLDALTYLHGNQDQTNPCVVAADFDE
jgi:hypothetical protein